MGSSLIAALVVMLIMTLFAFIILRIVAMNTGNVLRDNVVKQLQSYDSIIRRKESELTEIKKQIENEQKRLTEQGKVDSCYEQPPGGTIITATAEYCNYDFLSDYRNIKNTFLFPKAAILAEIRQDNKEAEQRALYRIYESICDKLTLDIVYKLSVCTGEEQLEILMDILSKEEQSLLEEFNKQKEPFDCLQFYHWLQVQLQLKDYRLYVKTGEKSDSFQELGDNINTEYDEELCEGFQVMLGSRLYDYGIRRCELV